MAIKKKAIRPIKMDADFKLVSGLSLIGLLSKSKLAKRKVLFNSLTSRLTIGSVLDVFSLIVPCYFYLYSSKRQRLILQSLVDVGIAHV